MPLTASQYLERVLERVGDPEGILGGQLTDLWKMHDDKSPIQVQYLFVVVEAANIYLARLRELYRFAEGRRRVELKDIFDNMLTIRSIAAQEITEVAISYQQSYPMIDEMETTAPIDAPSGSFVDANDPYYHGTPYGVRAWLRQE